MTGARTAGAPPLAAGADRRSLLGHHGLERAEGIEPSSPVWKTGVLTITQRPLTKRFLFDGC